MLKKNGLCFLPGIKIIMLSFLLLQSFISFAQQKITVKGTVVSEKSVPLSDVSVKVERESNGTITEPDGSFTVRVNKGAE